MAEKTTPITADQSNAPAPQSAAPQLTGPQPSHETAARRTVTLPLLPLAIVSAIVGALVFFGGGVAVGFAVGDHPMRTGIIRPFTNDGNRPFFGGQNGFGPNNGQTPNDRQAPAPKNG
jgi:hypothetical protein